MPIIGFPIWRLHPTLLLFIFLIISEHVNAMSEMQGSYENVVKKQFTTRIPRSRSRFLAQKGTQCNSGNAKECVSSNGGTGQMMCCSKVCIDVLSDTNNCGSCGKPCPFGQLCCMGMCTTLAYDETNCGGCGIECKNGSKCMNGFCGYAS
ncbi:hypothetical protein LUZ62_066354 [Rhynchospora pubera]|uniref:Stig1 n=1 Tax=Rhynchospora pubera TaxID=906938 RepID=A0AAV8ETI2_9POAL|nr:hypothetical protein LUZ62_066354 [Rhynchospora pubera]